MRDGLMDEEIDRISELMQEGLKQMKSYTIECAKGQGISYKRIIIDATTRNLGYDPSVFSNALYKKLSTPRAVLANMSTEIKAMSDMM